jgi:hypothetical protein
MITPAYGLTSTERVLPRMALDFTTGTLDPRVTVTRALNTATRTNSSGYIESVNADLPRFDYDPSTLAPKGLLIEETRQNLFLYSDQFNDAYWSKGNTNITPNAVVSPDNTTNADAMITTSTTGVFYVLRSVTTTAAAHTFTIYAKPSEPNGYNFLFLFNGTIGQGRVFNVSNGTKGGTAGNSAPTSDSITPVGNGFYRCSITVTCTAAANSFRAYVMSTDAATASFTADGVSGLYLYGAQLELGAFATSYIPTTSTSLTRNADVVTMSGTNLTNWYNATESTLIFEFQRALLSKESYALSLQEGNTTNIISFIANADNTLTAQVRDSVAGVTFTEPKALTGGIMKVGIAAAANNTIASWDGVLGTQDTTVTMPSSPATVLNIGFVNTNYGYLNGYVRKISYWGYRITNAELQAFTK